MGGLDMKSPGLKKRDLMMDWANLVQPKVSIKKPLAKASGVTS
jgi:hypothetical protein